MRVQIGSCPSLDPVADSPQHMPKVIHWFTTLLSPVLIRADSHKPRGTEFLQWRVLAETIKKLIIVWKIATTADRHSPSLVPEQSIQAFTSTVLRIQEHSKDGAPRKRNYELTFIKVFF